MNGTQGAIHFDITGDDTDLQRALMSSRSAIIASGDAADQQGARIEQMFKRATAGAITFFSAARATDFVKSMATVHGKFQSIQIALSTILGSEAEANKLFEQLKDTAAKTPFDLKGVASGAKQLLAYGEGADTVNSTLIKLGNIAAGLSQPLGDIVYLYGTTMTQGRLYTQDLNQFTGRGIPMIRELAKEFGVAESEVKKLVESGKVGFPEVQKVINNLTSETGMFYDLMEKQSAAITGKISNLGDAWASALDEMGKSSEGFLYSGIEGATYLVEHYETVLKILATLITAYGSYKAAIIAINAVQKAQATIEATRALLAQTQMLRRATQAQILFNQAVKANPYVLAFSALVTVVSALAMFSKKADEAKDSALGLSNANKRAGEEFDKEAGKIKALQGIVTNANVAYDKRKEALDELQKIVPNYNASLTKEGELLNSNTDAIKEYLVQLERQIKMKAAQEELEEAYRLQRKQKKELEELDAEAKYRRSLANSAKMTTNSAIHNSGINTGVAVFAQNNAVDASLEDRAKRAEKAAADVRASLQETESVIAELNEEIATTSTATNKSTTKFKTFSEQLEAAKIRIKTLKGELKDLLAGKGDVSNFAQAIEDKRKEIAQAEDAYAYLRGLDPKKKSSATTSSTDYKTKIDNEGREIERMYKDMELSIQKTRVDSMKDGLEKVLAQNELNHQLEIESIRRQREDLLKKIQEKERTEWESENPDWKKKGLTYTPTTKELPQEAVEQFDTLTKAANDKLVADNKRAIDEMLEDYATYEQKRSKIKEEHERKRKSLYREDGSLREGVTQGNVEEVNRSENEALKAVDEEFAQREETYQAWMNAITNMTLKQLQMVLEQAEKELADLEKSGNADSKQIAVARAKVNTARKKVTQANADNDLTPKKRTIKEWEDLYKTLMEAEKEFESIGDTVDGTAGKIISATGQIMTSTLSMINGIVQLTTASTTGMETAAMTSSAAIQTVEKASVILTIISAAMQIAMTIINLFNNDEEYQKEIENLQRRIDQLQWELDNAETVRMQQRSFDVLEKLKQVYAETRAEVLKLHEAEQRRNGIFYRMLSPAIHQNEILRKSAEKLAVAYANIEYTADKALGAAKFDEAKDKLRNIAQQQLLIQEQIRNEDAKKKTDYGKIEEWERQIQELGEEANNIINEIVEEIIGGSSVDIAKELGDAFFDAFQAGEDAAEAWGKKVDDIVADIIRRMLISRFLEEPLGEIFDKYKSKWYKDGEFAGIDAIMESMSGFASDLNQVGDEFQAIWDNLPDSIKNMLPVDEASREASERGIATASQESVDENNGRLTVIQSHTYTMNENVKTLVVLSDKILEAMWAIRNNTEHCKKLGSIDAGLTTIRRKIDEIGDNGLKVR